MPRIVYEHSFDGFDARVARLGLAELVDDLKKRLCGWRLEVEERKNANGGGHLRGLIDDRFAGDSTWKKRVSGGVDFIKHREVDGIRVGLGVEIQVSARSDMVAVDLLHLKQDLHAGEIDAGILVVPSNQLAHYLVSRAPNVTDSLRILNSFDAGSLPICLWGIEHDGAGAALPVKGRRNRGGQPGD